MTKASLQFLMIAAATYTITAAAESDLFDTIGSPNTPAATTAQPPTVTTRPPAVTARPPTVTAQPPITAQPPARSAAPATPTAADTRGCIRPVSEEATFPPPPDDHPVHPDPIRGDVWCAENASSLRQCGPVQAAVANGYNPYGTWKANKRLSGAQAALAGIFMGITSVEIKIVPDNNGKMVMRMPQVARDHGRQDFAAPFFVCKDVSSSQPPFMRIMGKNYPIGNSVTLGTGDDSANFVFQAGSAH